MTKDKIFYIILIFIIIVILTIGFMFNVNFKYWICCTGGLIFIAWNKDLLTGTKWFEKPKLIPEKRNSPSYAMADKHYEEYENKNYSLTSEEEKEGYLTLSKYCITAQSQAKLLLFFESLRDFSKDKDYMTTLNYVIEFLYKEEISFIMQFDWKSDIENFEAQLNIFLKENHNSLTIELPKAENYDSKATISYDNIFEDFDIPLRQNGLQLGFIDTQSDEYIVIIHKIIDREVVGNSVNKLGYKYFEK